MQGLRVKSQVRAGAWQEYYGEYFDGCKAECDGLLNGWSSIAYPSCVSSCATIGAGYATGKSLLDQMNNPSKPTPTA